MIKVFNHNILLKLKIKKLDRYYIQLTDEQYEQLKTIYYKFLETNNI